MGSQDSAAEMESSSGLVLSANQKHRVTNILYDTSDYDDDK